MGHEAHIKSVDEFDDKDDEKNAECPDAEGGHALLEPQIYVGGGDVMVGVVHMQADVEGGHALFMPRIYMNRYRKLPRHRALGPSRCPEYCMGSYLICTTPWMYNTLFVQHLVCTTPCLYNTLFVQHLECTTLECTTLECTTLE